MDSFFEFALNKIGWEAVSAVSGVFIAIIGFMISRNLRNQEQRARKYALLAEYRKEIIAFSKEYFETVSEALSVRNRFAETQDARAELDRLSNKLSSLVDTGRFLFPNHVPGEGAEGLHKGPAFAGRRRPPLDAILAAHYAVEAMKREGNAFGDYLNKSLTELRKTGQPLSTPVRETDPVYLLIQSRRCYLNAVVPDTFPREWTKMFTVILGPVEQEPTSGGDGEPS